MSRKKSEVSTDIGFSERFIEICGSSQPVEIAQLLNISYQAAKNYLRGRLPDTNSLRSISEKTDYSINWLLTGEGEKLVKNAVNRDTLILTDQMRTFVRQTCLEVISEMLSIQNSSAGQKIVVLTSENIKEEKIMDESSILTEKSD